MTTNDEINVSIQLAARIVTRRDKWGTFYVALDAMNGEEIDEDYSVPHLKARMQHDGWQFLN